MQFPQHGPEQTDESIRAAHERRLQNVGRESQGQTLGHDMLYLIGLPWRLVKGLLARRT